MNKNIIFVSFWNSNFNNWNDLGRNKKLIIVVKCSENESVKEDYDNKLNDDELEEEEIKKKKKTKI